MKVIITGASGFIGKAVFIQCLKNPAITELVALSRKDIPESATHPKLNVVIMKDFDSYPNDVLEKLKGAEACIWSIGTYNWDPVVELDYPEAFQQALLKTLDVTKTFRYVYLGGAFTETDQERNLWFLSKGRKMRGLAQTKLLKFAKLNPNVDPYVVKPAGVLARGGIQSVGYLVRPLQVPIVWVDELGAAMVDLALNGGDESVVSNQAIVMRGKNWLVKQASQDI